jgi:hypothetical protein
MTTRIRLRAIVGSLVAAIAVLLAPAYAQRQGGRITLAV